MSMAPQSCATDHKLYPMSQSNCCPSLHQELVSHGVSCGMTDSTAKLLSDKTSNLSLKLSKVGWIPLKVTVGFHENKTAANKDNIYATVQDSWQRTSGTAIHPHLSYLQNTLKERRNSIHEPFPSSTGKRSRCGIIGFFKLYKHKKCCSNGKIAFIMKTRHSLLVWMIFQDLTDPGDMLICRVGFISFPGSCLRLHQVMVRVMRHTYKIYKRSSSNLRDLKTPLIM